jgi:glutathione peroxidase
MRRLLTLSIVILSAFLLAADSADSPGSPDSVYDFELNRIDGTPEALSIYEGKVLMIVNVASKCGNTPQYEGLETLYSKYRDQGLVVLGFPANDFGGQEPGTNEEIAEYCRATWAVDFPIFEKISVKGEDQHPLYAFITKQPAPIGGEITWNFQKFLVDRNGQLVARIEPRTKPLDTQVVAQVESLLAN